MSKYIIVVNTDNFKPFKATLKNWENETCNDFMRAINGFTIAEKNLDDLKNRLCLMFGYAVDSKYYQDKYRKWLVKSDIKYRDNICEIDRKQTVGIYGIAQGYIDINSHIEEMSKTGKSRIYFKNAYDIRQNGKNYAKCYIEIIKK